MWYSYLPVPCATFSPQFLSFISMNSVFQSWESFLPFLLRELSMSFICHISYHPPETPQILFEYWWIQTSIMGFCIICYFIAQCLRLTFICFCAGYIVGTASLSHKVGGLYCLFCLYETQPCKPPFKIYISLGTYVDFTLNIWMLCKVSFIPSLVYFEKHTTILNGTTL